VQETITKDVSGQLNKINNDVKQKLETAQIAITAVSAQLVDVQAEHKMFREQVAQQMQDMNNNIAQILKLMSENPRAGV